jgi:hypothetical protein
VGVVGREPSRAETRSFPAAGNLGLRVRAARQFALDDYRSFNSNIVHDRAAFAASLAARQNSARAEDATALTLAKGPLDKTLAQKTRQSTIALAQSLAGEDLGYAAGVAFAAYSYDTGSAQSRKDHGYAVQQAEIDQTIAADGVSSADREATAAARGDYEYTIAQDYADKLTALAQASGQPLDAYRSAVAAVDAHETDLRRGAQQAYQQALTTASHDYTQSATALPSLRCAYAPRPA